MAKGWDMTVRTEMVNGRKALVADLPGGGVKVVFENGDTIFGFPEPVKESKPPTNKRTTANKKTISTKAAKSKR